MSEHKTRSIILSLLMVMSMVAIAAPASAATTTDVSIDPGSQDVGVDNTVTYDVVVDSVDNGIGSYEFIASVGDTATATITDVSLEGRSTNNLNTVNISSDGSSADVDVTSAGTSSGTIATVTVEGASAGSTQLSLSDVFVFDDNGNGYTIGSTNPGTVNVTAGAGGNVGFEVTDVEVSPTEVQSGNTFDVSANVTNNGLSDGTTQTINFDANNNNQDSTSLTLDDGETTEVNFNGVANTSGDYVIGANTIEVTSDDDVNTAQLIVSDAGERAALTGNIRTTTGQSIPNAEDVRITLEADGIVIVDEVRAGDFDDLADNNAAIDAAGFNANDEAYTVNIPAFDGPTNYTVTAELTGFESFAGTEEVRRGETSTQNIRIESNLQPAELGLAAVELDDDGNVETVIGDGAALLADGQLDNNVTFIAFAQSQTGGAVTDNDVDLTHDGSGVFDGTNGIFRVEDGDGGFTNSSTTTVTLDSETTLNASDVQSSYADEDEFEDSLVDPDGEVSVATFEITADAVDEDFLEGTDVNVDSDFLENFAINAEVDTNGDLDVDADDATDIENFDSESRADFTGTPDTLTISSDALYFVEGDKSVSGDVRTAGNNDNRENVTVYAIYDAAPDQSLDTVSDFLNSDGESFLVDTSSEGGYEITGLAGDGTEFTLYAVENGFNSVPSDATDQSITTSVAAAEGLTTSADGRDVTQDLVMQPEVQEYQIDVTAEDFDSQEFEKVARQPAASANSEVRIEVNSRAEGDSAAEFTPAPAGTEVELELFDTANPDAEIGSSLNETATVQNDGLAFAEFTPAVQDDETLNVSATVTNADGDEYVTNDDEGEFASDDELNTDANQSQIQVFRTGELTGDVVDEDDQNVANASVELLVRDDGTSGSFVAPSESSVSDQLPSAVVGDNTRVTGPGGSYAFINLPTEGIDYRVEATFQPEDETFTGFAEQGEGSFSAGTNNADIVITGLVVDDGGNNGADAPELSEYQNEDGEVEIDGLRDAIDDFTEGRIDIQLLRDVIDAFSG